MGEAKRRREAAAVRAAMDEADEMVDRVFAERMASGETTAAEDVAHVARLRGWVSVSLKFRPPGVRATCTVTAMAPTEAEARAKAEREMRRKSALISAAWAAAEAQVTAERRAAAASWTSAGAPTSGTA